MLKEKTLQIMNTFENKKPFKLSSLVNHYENTPIQIYWKFYNQKRKIFR